MSENIINITNNNEILSLKANDGLYKDKINENSLDNSTLEFEIIPIEKIYANPNQPRKIFEKTALDGLAQSIKENGILQPILVRQIGEKYQIISGERRYRASIQAGLESMPAVIRRMSEEKTMLASLIENIQRQDLNPIEEARTLRDIILNFGLTHDQLAEKIGRSRSALTNRLRLLQLPYDVQMLVANGEISAGHAKMLAGLKSSQEIKEWANKIIKNNLSVYETEKQLAQNKTKLSNNNSNKKNLAQTSNPHIRSLEDMLQERLGAKVRIRQGKNKGHIEIEFYNKNDLERVVEAMMSLSV